MMIHPDAMDITEYMKQDTVYIQYEFMASDQFKMNEIFQSDIRNIGIAGSFIITSKTTHELWRPLDKTMDEISNENLVSRWHILDEYTISLNLAKNKFKKEGIGNLQHFLHLGVEGENNSNVLIKAKKLMCNYIKHDY
jgi:hypothetical protein